MIIDSMQSPIFSTGDVGAGNNNDIPLSTGPLPGATTLYVSAQQERAALTFQGVDEHVEVPHDPSQVEWIPLPSNPGSSLSPVAVIVQLS